jgi:hypothetical protein
MVESSNVATGSSWPAFAQGYQLITPIGSGSFGLVWKAKCVDGSN